MIFGILKETKIPTDNRCALTPYQCSLLLQQYPQLQIYVQPSDLRCYREHEYEHVGCHIQDDLSQCDVLWGVKEPKIDTLIADKTYVLFSHTKKKQPYNKALLQAFLQKNIRLIDYECLVDEKGDRILGFGAWAGVVGAHEALLQYGNRTKSYSMPAAHTVRDFASLKKIYDTLSLPPMKVVLTGAGRVASGVKEVMDILNIKHVEPQDFLHTSYKQAVYTQVNGSDLYEKISDGSYDRQDFHHHPEAYRCKFIEYIAHTDILINGIYWDKNMPRLFQKEDVQKPEWKIQTISDITCDAFGSVPITVKYTTILDPVFGFDKKTLQEGKVYLEDSIDIVSVDNLPNELPRDASDFFSDKIVTLVVPEFFKEKSELLYRATITLQSKLNTPFEYLQDYAFSSVEAL